MEQEEQEIVAQVTLIKALVQQRQRLQYEISNESIKKNYFKFNLNWRILIELFPLIKQIKLHFLKFRAYINSRADDLRKKVNIEELVKKCTEYSRLIQTWNNSFQIDIINKDLDKHKLTSLKLRYKEKSTKLEQLSIISEKNAKKLEINHSKILQINETKVKISALSADIKNIKLRLKPLILSKNINKGSFRDIEKALTFSTLSKSKLNLKSKLLLKEEMTKVLFRAKEAFESYQHFLLLEKRKVQKLCHLIQKETNESLSNELNTRPQTFSNQFSPQDILGNFNLSTIKSFSSSSNFNSFVSGFSEEDSNLNSIEVINSDIQQSLDLLSIKLTNLKSN